MLDVHFDDDKLYVVRRGLTLTAIFLLSPLTGWRPKTNDNRIQVSYTLGTCRKKRREPRHTIKGPQSHNAKVFYLEPVADVPIRTRLW
jgi:hypothetical protein